MIWAPSTWFTTSIESIESPHLTKTLIHRFVTKTLFVETIFGTSCGAPQTCPQLQNFCVSIFADFKDFIPGSHMPPTNLHFPKFAKSSQEILSQLCPLNPPQGNTIPPMWSDLSPWGRLLSSFSCKPQRSFSLFQVFPGFLPWLSSLALIWNPRVTFVKCYVSWVESPLSTFHAQGTPTLPYIKTFISSFTLSIFATRSSVLVCASPHLAS